MISALCHTSRAFRRPRLAAAIAAVAALCVAVPSAAQSGDAEESYRFDAGAMLGMSGYLGDANSSNMFAHPGFAGKGTFAWLPNNRMAVRGTLGVSTLSGDTADGSDILPGGANYKFSSTVYDLSAAYEFNFMGYGIGETYKRLSRWSPFVSAGIGMSLASCEGSTYAGLSVPLAVGVKYKLRQRINLRAQLTVTKVLCDNLDGPNLSDPYGIESSFLKNNDWHTSLSIGVTFEFGKRCVTCHRID